MTRGEKRQALRVALEDLEVRLEAYLTEWRDQYGIQEDVGAGIARDEQTPSPTKREKGAQAQTQHPKWRAYPNAPARFSNRFG